jgi:hypothetical protein
LRYARVQVGRKILQYVEIAEGGEEGTIIGGIGDETPGDGVGTFGRKKGWNGTFRDGWNLWEGKMVERNF